MKRDFAAIWTPARPLVTGLVILLLLNIGLYAFLPPPQISYQDPPRSVRLDFDSDHSGTGWYSPERTSDDTTFQWTSSVEATLSLNLAIDNPLEIEFRIINGDPDVVAGLQLSANQIPIPLEHSGDHFSGVIPKSVVDQHPASLDLAFHTPTVRRPSDNDPKNSDTRTLGVAFDWLIVRPHPDHNTLYEFDDGCTADNGWYSTETDPNGSNFCWSAATDATLSIHVPRGKAFTIEVGGINAITRPVLDSFVLEINGASLQAQRTSHSGGWLYTAESAPLDVEEAVLTFHVDQLVAPATVNGGTDQRPLGIQVDWLRITEKTS